jgi:hypothetical protein
MQMMFVCDLLARQRLALSYGRSHKLLLPRLTSIQKDTISRPGFRSVALTEPAEAMQLHWAFHHMVSVRVISVLDKTSYLRYKLEPKARVCISDKDQMRMFYRA